MPTDRGYVVLTERQDGTFDVEISMERTSPGRAVAPFALHSQVSGVVVETDDLDQEGRIRRSTKQLQVFSDSEDGLIHISEVQRIPMSG